MLETLFYVWWCYCSHLKGDSLRWSRFRNLIWQIGESISRKVVLDVPGAPISISHEFKLMLLLCTDKQYTARQAYDFLYEDLSSMWRLVKTHDDDYDYGNWLARMFLTILQRLADWFAERKRVDLCEKRAYTLHLFEESFYGQTMPREVRDHISLYVLHKKAANFFPYDLAFTKHWKNTRFFSTGFRHAVVRLRNFNPAYKGQALLFPNLTTIKITRRSQNPIWVSLVKIDTVIFETENLDCRAASRLPLLRRIKIGDRCCDPYGYAFDTGLSTFSDKQQTHTTALSIVICSPIKKSLHRLSLALPRLESLSLHVRTHDRPHLAPQWSSTLTSLKMRCSTDYARNSEHCISGIDLARLRSLSFYCYVRRPLDVLLPQLTNLNMLKLISCGIETLPSSIGLLTNLELLSLHNNQLCLLPEEIGRLTMLRTLRLGCNQLDRLPDSLCDLTRLETLDLSSNRLQELPSVLTRMSSLHHLDLSYNKMKRSAISLQLQNVSFFRCY